MKKKILFAIPVLLILAVFLFAQTGNVIRLFDTNFSNVMPLVWNENDTSDRTFNITVNGGNRTFALHANLTVESASLINQDLTTDSSTGQLAALTLGTGELTAGSINRASGTLLLEIGGTPEVSITSTLTTFGGDILADTARLSDLTDGYVPYHVNDATGLTDSVMSQSGTAITVTHAGSNQEFKDNEVSIIREDGGPALALYTRIASISSGAFLGHVRFQGNENGAGDVIAAAISGVADGDWTSNTDAPSRLAFYTTDDGTAVLDERMRIDNAGVFYLYQNSDTWTLTGDATDWWIQFQGRYFIIQNDEAGNNATNVHIRPKGTSEISNLVLYDTNSQELTFNTASGRGYISSGAGALGLNASTAQDIKMFEGHGSGFTYELMITGFKTGDAQRTLEIGVGQDAADTASFDGVSNYYFDGNLGVGTFAPAAGLHGVVTDGLLLWADSEADNASKLGHWGIEHFDVDEEPFYAIRISTTTNVNAVVIGGGSALGNAATDITFFTAADNVTQLGTLRMHIDSAGIVSMPFVYLHDMDGETYRNLLINDSGELGYDATPAPIPSEMFAHIQELEARITQLENLLLKEIK